MTQGSFMRTCKLPLQATLPSSQPATYVVLSAGTATADFVIFPPRWTVSQHTFRPPCERAGTPLSHCSKSSQGLPAWLLVFCSQCM